MTLEQRARELAQYAAECCQWLHDGTPRHYTDRCEAKILEGLRVVEREALERAANEAHELWDNGIPSQEFATRIRALIDTPASEAPVANEQKVQPVLCFEGGTLTLRQSGYGGDNGGGWFAFEEDDLECHPHDEKSGHYYIARVDKSELAALRDWLNTNISTLDHVTAPGHTDLMVSPESIDAFMEANPLPAPDPRDAEIERLREVVRTLDEAMESFIQHARVDGMTSHYFRIVYQAIEAARQTLDK